MRFGFPTRHWSRAILWGLLCVGVSASAATPDTPAKDSSSTSPAHPASGTTSKRKPSTKKSASTAKHLHGKTKGKKKRGQQAIDSPRAREIQEALIREHYMEGKPSGKWDAATQDALVRYQADQGWQTKTVPDSRALIKLGLGPSKDGLLNPESAMTAEPLASDPKAGTKPKTGDPVNRSSNPIEQSKPQQ